MLLAKLIDKALRAHRLTLVDWRGQSHPAGPGRAPQVGVVRINTARAARNIIIDPLKGVGDAYMSGELEVLEGDLVDILAAILTETQNGRSPMFMRWRQAANDVLRALQQINTNAQSRRHISHHYDLDYDFYRLWLDPDLHYSCGFHERPDVALEEAQAAKDRRIAAKLALRPGDRVLDIGCGWGAMAIHLVKTCDVSVTGISLSKEQIAVAEQRVAAAGLSDKITFKLQDYRDHEGCYHRIVSVGMLEHVGAPNLPEFFRVVHRNLTEDGVALIHTIGRVGPPAATNPWIRKHIFPGGFLPSLSQISRAVERSTLITADVEVLRLHYAHTLHAWRERFLKAREQIVARYDETFFRMWDFYLSCSEASFLAGVHVNYQVQLCRRLDALPFSRDYLYVQGDEPAERRAPALRAVR